MNEENKKAEQQLIENEDKNWIPKSLDVIKFASFIGFATAYDYMFEMSSLQLLGLSIFPVFYTYFETLSDIERFKSPLLFAHIQTKLLSTKIQRVAKLSIFLPFLLYWFRNHTWGFGLILLGCCV